MATSADPGALVRATPVRSPFRFRARRLLSGLAAGAMILLSGVVLPGCDDEIVLPSTPTLTLSPTGPIDLEVGETVQLSASVTGHSGAVSFASANAGVASVSASNGLVTALSPGVTTITATVAGTTLSQSVQVRVVAPPVEDLSGSFNALIRIITDPADEDQYVFNAGDGTEIVLDLSVERGSNERIVFTLSEVVIGPSTLPELTGEGEVGQEFGGDVAADGLSATFELAGQGTIAGYPEVSVAATGTVDDAGLSIRITVGENDALPSRESLVYEAEGGRQ